jgi:hypothetical protein
MDNSVIYGQMDFNLPHDVVMLPSGGKFYSHKKKSFKVGYLTAQDENIIISTSSKNDSIITLLLKNKIYEPDVNVDELLEGDAEALLIFLRNTAFGPEYNFNLKDPKTGKDFSRAVLLDELDIIKPKFEPNSRGYFEFKLPKTNSVVECKILSVGENNELNKLMDLYPEGTIVPIATKRLEKIIVTVDGNDDRETIAKFVNNLPMMDSKFIKNNILDCEPKLDLRRKVIAPSGEELTVRVTFGAEFFRPFF